MIVQLWMISFLATSGNAQTIAHIQPDAAAPGMTIALEILAHQDSIGTFGPDGFAPPGLQVKLADDLDKQRVIVGVPVVSWRGRMIQVPLFVLPKAWFGPVMLRVVRGNTVSAPVSFEIVQPRLPIDVVGSVTLGDSSLGRTLTQGNTLVVQSMNIRGDLGNRSQVVLDVRDPDPSTPGNPRYLPLTILSAGPIKLTNVDLDLSAHGKAGGPGGGAGGSGNQGTGGIGYTGGGSSTATSDSNVGSATGPTTSNGGNSITGAVGGGSDQSDQGGGGGTGHPFGTSGAAGVPNDDSSPGGYGGGSAGGEDLDAGAFGGGGGAFAHDATTGVGQGNNAGKRTGGRLLLPLAGGSGGGAGNSRDDDIYPAGSGGGGGGALAIIGFDAVELTNTKFLLRGDSGTTGIDNTGGGGGGAGGGVVAAGAASFKADRLTINVDSGKGGNGTTNGFAGGAGSIGMSRIDGIDECLNCQLPATNRTALSQKRLPQQVNKLITVEGYAGGSDLFTDNIAIYYRNSHSEWVRVDTVAFELNGRRVWKKTIPALNDALLFVSAYQQVNAPRNADTHDLEPTWISTHVSHQIVNTTSRAQAEAPDTIYFPLTKVDQCRDTNVIVRNRGEAMLNITSLNAAAPFEANDFVRSIGGYDSGTVTLSYCPKAAGCDTLMAALVTDAGIDSIVLIGCAILTDEQVQFSPSNTLEFNPTRVGECDTMTLVVRSVGEDTVTIQFGRLLRPPFNIDTTGKKTRLGKQELETFTVTFCPTDSGLVSDTARMVDPDNDIFVFGVGLRSILVKRDIVFDGPLCLNYGTVVQDTIFNFGNEPIQIDEVSIEAPEIKLTSTGPWSIPAQSLEIFEYVITPSARGSFEDTVFYKYRSDLVARGRFLYTASERNVVAAIPDFYVCADQTAEQTLSIVNEGNRAASISITGFDGWYSPLDPSDFEIGQGARSVRILFDPPNEVGAYRDTIQIKVTTEGCGDTVLNVVLAGFGTSERLAFSNDSIEFGSLTIGECKTDSIFVTNVCGPPDRIISELLPDLEGFSVSIPDTLQLGTGDGVWVVYKFCPKNAGEATRSHAINTSDTIISIFLRGVGIPKITSDSIWISQSSIQMIIGEVKPTHIRLDRLSGSGSLDTLKFSLAYDPSIVKLVAITPLAGTVVNNEGPILGKVGIVWTGPLTEGSRLELSWQALLGESAVADLRLEEVASSPTTAMQITNGSIMISDCFGLAGNIRPGRVAVGVIRPQPVGSGVKVAIRSSTDFTANAVVHDELGRVSKRLSVELQQGDQLISLPTFDLPPGAYWLEITVAGYRHVQRFWKE